MRARTAAAVALKVNVISTGGPRENAPGNALEWDYILAARSPFASAPSLSLSLSLSLFLYIAVRILPASRPRWIIKRGTSFTAVRLYIHAGGKKNWRVSCAHSAISIESVGNWLCGSGKRTFTRDLWRDSRAKREYARVYIYGWDAALVNGILNALSTIFSMINRRGCGSSFLFFSLLPPSCPFVLRLFALRASVIRRRGGSLRVVNHGSVRLLNLHADREWKSRESGERKKDKFWPFFFSLRPPTLQNLTRARG